MFGISGTELIIILFFGFLIFGPDKLPQMGRTVGRAIRQFRSAADAANKKFKEEVADPFNDAIAPYKDQVEEASRPLQDDINAINDTLNETKSMITDPFKDMFAPSKPAAKPAKGAAIPGGSAPDAGGRAVAATGGANADAAVDPFADAPSVIPDDASVPPSVIPSEARSAESRNLTTTSSSGDAGKPLPNKSGTVKVSLAATLYGLEEEPADVGDVAEVDEVVVTSIESDAPAASDAPTASDAATANDAADTSAKDGE